MISLIFLFPLLCKLACRHSEKVKFILQWWLNGSEGWVMMEDDKDGWSLLREF